MRRLLALSFVLIATGSGCRMCASPYDYCGPVVDDCCCNSDYQPSVPYQGSPVAEMESMESSEPVYYESTRPMPTKAVTKPSNSNQFMATPTLPRQAKRPGSGNIYR